MGHMVMAMVMVVYGVDSAIGHIPMSPPSFRLYCDGSMSGYVSTSSAFNQYHPISTNMINDSIAKLDGQLYEITIVPSLIGHGNITLECDNGAALSTLTTSLEGILMV